MIPSPTLAPSYATLPPLAGPAPQLHPPSAPDLRSTTPTPGGGSRTPSLTLTATPGQAGSGTPYHTLQTPRADRTGLIEGMQASEDEGDGDAGVGAQGSDSRKGKQRASTGEGGAIGGPEYAEGQQTEEPEEEGLGQAELQGLRRRLDGFKTMPDAGGSSGQAWLEVIGMTRKLLDHTDRLPLLEQQVMAQQATIQTLQQQARLAQKLSAMEHDRYTADRQSWRAQAQALITTRERELAAGARPRKLELDVGYHQELEAVNKRLDMDNRLMAPRLADTQRQIDKLVNELRHLRSHVVLSTQPLAGPSTPRSQRRAISPARASTSATMGDARTEHLLLAARKVRSMRQANDAIGRLTLAELQRGGVLGPDGGLGYSEGYGAALDEYVDELDSDAEDQKPYIGSGGASASRRGKRAGQTTPLLPRVKRSGKRSVPPPTTPRSGRTPHGMPPQTTPGGSNFVDLLRAAEMATRPDTPSPDPKQLPPVPFSAMSATRSTTRPREDSLSPGGSPVKRQRMAPPTSFWDRTKRSSPMTGEDTASSQAGLGEESALDILAQASQLDEAQTDDSQPVAGQAPTSTRYGGLVGPEDRWAASPAGLAPAIDLRSGPPPQMPPSFSGVERSYPHSQPLPQHPPTPGISATPTARPRGPSFAAETRTPVMRRYSASQSQFETPFDETSSQMHRSSPPSGSGREGGHPPSSTYASPTGGAVPGLGKFTHLTSNMPARRVRSPYLKWTQEEDELLARAVEKYGEKWDLVSKGVPTRSYHQVRQRWLRKTGAFDKKPPPTPGSGLGPNGGGGRGGEEGAGMVVPKQEPGLMRMDEAGDEDEDGSPTPVTGGGGGQGGVRQEELREQV